MELIIDSRIEASQHLTEFEKLVEIYKPLKANYILEIGSLHGWSLHHWIEYSNKGSTVISIDLPVKDFVGPFDPRVQQQEKAISEEWPSWAKANKTKLYLIPQASQSNYVVQQVDNILDNNKLDFMFIDGNHFYDYVKLDFDLYKKFFKKGTVVAFHDIGENEEGTVNIFWNEVKTQYKHEEILLHNKKEKGIGVLYI